MSCKTCEHYKEPPRLGNDRVVGEKGHCHFMSIQGDHREVSPNESCRFDTTIKADKEF